MSPNGSLIDRTGALIKKVDMPYYCNHCHPTRDWDGSRILYVSDYDGRVQRYLLEF